MVVTVYTVFVLVLLVLFLHGFWTQIQIKNKFITDSDKKPFELELFGESDSNSCCGSTLEVLNSLEEDQLNELKLYYEKKEDNFDSQHRDFMNKANMYFQMYLFSWAYVGGLIIFLFTGNNGSVFLFVKNIHVLLFFGFFILLHFIFFCQVLSTLIFIPDYEIDAKNSVIKNISKSRRDYLRRTVQNKAYSYNCNSLLLKNIKAGLIYIPVKFIAILILITCLAIIVVCSKGG